MPSVDQLFGIALLGVFAACIWRFTSVIRELAQSGWRAHERNSAQRDRLVLQFMEKKSVEGNAQAAIGMAHLHTNEYLRQRGMDLQHDRQGEDKTKAQRLAERQARALLKEHAQQSGSADTGKGGAFE